MADRIISYSEITALRRCALKHQKLYAERWTKKAPPMSALGKGSAWHAVMEEHYRSIKENRQKLLDPAVRKRARVAVDRALTDMPTDLAQLIDWMYTGYVDLYGTDQQWQILGIEYKALARLRTPKGGRSAYVLKFIIDLVVRDKRNKKLLVVDHKSGKDLPKALALELDDQFGLYPWGMRQLGKPVDGLCWNAARTLRLKEDIKTPGAQPLEERFERKPLFRNQTELNLVAQEAYLTASTGWSALQRYRRMGVDAPRTTDIRQCSWGCDLYEACVQGRRGRSMNRFLTDQGFEVNMERH